jgi:hypothetical protein
VGVVDIVAAGDVAPRDAPTALPWLGVCSGMREAARATQRAPGCALRLRLGILGGVALRCSLKAPAGARQSRLGRAVRLASAGGLVINSNPDVFGSAAANGAPARDVRVFRLTSSSRPTF